MRVRHVPKDRVRESEEDRRIVVYMMGCEGEEK